MRLIIFPVVLFSALLIISGCSNNSTIEKTSDALTGFDALNTKNTSEKQLAIAAAQELWRIKNLEGTDFSSGPCLSNTIINGWVADIVHNPRTAVDDDPTNQCTNYRDGTAHHFVELDLQGNLIRAE